MFNVMFGKQLFVLVVSAMPCFSSLPQATRCKVVVAVLWLLLCRAVDFRTT